MQLTHQTETAHAAILGGQATAEATVEPLRVGVSSAVAADVAFTGALQQCGVVLRAAFDPSCDLTVVDMAEVTSAPTGGVVVASAAHPTAAEARRVLVRGAAGVIDRRGAPEAIVASFRAVLVGITVVPNALAPAVLARLEEPPPALDLTPTDLALLRDLASGITLDDVARLRGRSTRTIRRDLRDLWRRMDVTGRAQGLVRAARWGLVEAPVGD